MKKLFFTFIALLIVFFSAWGIKLRMPINRPNNVQGEQQVAWYETRYTAPTAEEEWTLDPEIPVNYLPVAGEDEVYMVLDDSGNIVGYRHRTQQEDGSWLWTDIEDPNAEHYEKVDGLDHIYKVTDKDGTSSYQQYVRNEDGSYAYVPVNENGVPLDDGADATTIDTTHYVHKSGNVYGLYNDNGVLTGYRERVKDGENYVWKVTDPPKSSTSDLQEWSEAKKDNANQGDLSADSGDGTQNSGNNGVIVGGSGAESSQIDNGDGTYTKTETNVSTKTEDGYCITYKTTVTSVYDTNGTLISTQKDGPYEVSREKLNVSEDPSAASAADTIDAEVARVSGKVSYDTTKAAELLAKLNADRASAGLGQLQMNTNSLTYKFVIPQLPEKQTNVPNEEELRLLVEQQKLIQQRMRTLEEYETTRKYSKLCREQQDKVDMLSLAAKTLDAKVGVKGIILQRILHPFEEACTACMQKLSRNTKIKFIYDGGVELYCEKNGGKMIPMKKVSTGEFVFVAFTLMSLISQITGTRLLVLDNLDSLDNDNLKTLIDLLQNEKQYENVFVAAVNHNDTCATIAAYDEVEIIEL